MALERGGVAGGGARHAHRQRADALREQRDPPERRGGGHGRQPPLRRRTARRASRRATAPTTRPSGACAPRRPRSRAFSPRTAASRRCRAPRRRRSSRAPGRRRPPTASPEARADAVAAIVAAAKAEGVLAFGLCRRRPARRSASSTRSGSRVSEPRSSAQLLTVTMGPEGGTGYAERDAVDVWPPRRGRRRARGRADGPRHGRPGRAAPRRLPGRPRAPTRSWTSSTCSGYLGFSALAVQEERSFFEPGRRIGSALITLIDDASDAAGTPASFDYEGVPTQRVTLLDAGVCRDVVHDAQTAARDGVASTGHGLPAPNPWGPFPLHMVMAAGTTPRE